MNRETAKTKDRLPARERCYNLLNRETPVFPPEVAKELGMIAGSVHSRMWELCLEGRASRVDFSGEWGYYQTKSENVEACAAHYQAEQLQKDLKAWKNFTEKIIPALSEEERKYLKAVKNSINARTA